MINIDNYHEGLLIYQLSGGLNNRGWLWYLLWRHSAQLGRWQDARGMAFTLSALWKDDLRMECQVKVFLNLCFTWGQWVLDHLSFHWLWEGSGLAQLVQISAAPPEALSLTGLGSADPPGSSLLCLCWSQWRGHQRPDHSGPWLPCGGQSLWRVRCHQTSQTPAWRVGSWQPRPSCNGSWWSEGQTQAAMCSGYGTVLAEAREPAMNQFEMTSKKDSKSPCFVTEATSCLKETLDSWIRPQNCFPYHQQRIWKCKSQEKISNKGEWMKLPAHCTSQDCILRCCKHSVKYPENRMISIKLTIWLKLMMYQIRMKGILQYCWNESQVKKSKHFTCYQKDLGRTQ